LDVRVMERVHSEEEEEEEEEEESAVREVLGLAEDEDGA
jgi:hypothetical protein